MKLRYMLLFPFSRFSKRAWWNVMKCYRNIPNVAAYSAWLTFTTNYRQGKILFLLVSEVTGGGSAVLFTGKTAVWDQRSEHSAEQVRVTPAVCSRSWGCSPSHHWRSYLRANAAWLTHSLLVMRCRSSDCCLRKWLMAAPLLIKCPTYQNLCVQNVWSVPNAAR